MEYQRKEIKGYTDYEIDTVGNVFTTKGNSPHLSEDGKLSVRIQSAGYHQIKMYHQGKIHQRLVHRLMWETFIGDIPDDMTIDHIDDNRENNVLSNLQLMSRGENTKKSWDKRGRSTKKQIVLDWHNRGYTRKFIADNLGITMSYVSMIINGKR